ncbi:MAG: methyltransferase domain-containing protein [Acidimicrobiia bacterium]|nr:methyltransferase domain-containing protein [Acidimicrobiia bacterium]
MNGDRLSEQVEYYRARAPEYDDWWLRRGRYDAGPEHTAQWKAEIAELRGAVEANGVGGWVLELAGGTGSWTTMLARRAAELTVVDAAPEALARNRRKLAALPRACPVRFVEADLFSWAPDQRYDLVFFAFWLSHVPESHFGAFWDLVASALVPGGRFFLLDGRYDPAVAGLAGSARPDGETSVRELADGRRYRIVKVFREPDDLALRLGELGWSVTTGVTGPSFLYAHGSRALG